MPVNDSNMLSKLPDAQIVKFEDGVTDESMFILSFAVTNPEVFNWYADPTVIIASKADIEKHNTIASSHPDIRALLSSLNENIDLAMPTGISLEWNGATIPTGFLAEDKHPGILQSIRFPALWHRLRIYRAHNRQI